MSWHFVLCLNEKHLHSKKKILLIRLKIVFHNRVTSACIAALWRYKTTRDRRQDALWVLSVPGLLGLVSS